jgi:NADH:ubiquinone oxidoreductase subunit
MASLLKEIFIWWDGNTWGNRWTIWRLGRFVGRDEFGNTYYEQKRGVGPLGRPRRWVVYAESAEPSRVPPGWHGWLHYKVDAPPAPDYRPRPWQKPHVPNLTGTPAAYRPPGSIISNVEAKPARGYKPWRPD